LLPRAFVKTAVVAGAFVTTCLLVADSVLAMSKIDHHVFILTWLVFLSLQAFNRAALHVEHWLPFAGWLAAVCQQAWCVLWWCVATPRRPAGFSASMCYVDKLQKVLL
jgi:hypothetical protein